MCVCTETSIFFIKKELSLLLPRKHFHLVFIYFSFFGVDKDSGLVSCVKFTIIMIRLCLFIKSFDLSKNYNKSLGFFLFFVFNPLSIFLLLKIIEEKKQPFLHKHFIQFKILKQCNSPVEESGSAVTLN